MDTNQLKKGIHFNPKKHVYTNAKGDKYISGTKFISLFKQPFDSDFWQKYKAVQRLLDDKPNVWKQIKMKYLKTEDKSLFYEAAFNKVSPVKVAKLQKEIAKEWKDKSNKALSKGTKFHDGEEDKIRKKYNYTHDWNWLDLSTLSEGIYPELRLYNHDYQIAGSADKIRILKNKQIIIEDYKSNAKLDFESWTNPWTKNENKMLHVCSDMDDCSFNHYTLQLSLYGWMMEQLGYKVKKLVIKHILFDENGKAIKRVPYTCEYMKHTIENMLEYYKNNLQNK